MLFDSAVHVLATSALGLVAHAYSYYNQPTTVTGTVILLFGPPIVSSLLPFQVRQQTSPIHNTLVTTVVYLTSLVASIVLYRLSPFHPLAKYPGPIICRVTRLWATYKASTGKQHVYYHQLHERYGDIVRTGPNHLFIRNVKAISVVHGPGPIHSRWVRTNRYKLGNPGGSTGNLIGITSPAEHSHRRRIWDRAFTNTALDQYEPMIQRRAEQLVDVIRDHKETVIDLGIWISFFALDFMGDLAFSSTFNSLQQGKDENHLQRIVEKGTRIQEVLGTIPWTRMFLLALPKPPTFKKMRGIALDNVVKRKEEGVLRKDIFFHLLDEDKTSGHEPLSVQTLILESVLVLGAGTDTTAVALCNVFYYLLTNHGALDQLRKELDENISHSIEQPDVAVLNKLPFLQAVTNETLRLQPGVPNGMQRMPPRNESAVVYDDLVVPPQTTVQIPVWSLHRDPRYFWPHPESFYPDRWLPEAQSSPGFRLETTAWIPFGHGPMNCVGKQLALNEMKIAIVAIVRNFDLALDPEWDPREWEKNLEEGYLWSKGKLPIIATVRRS